MMATESTESRFAHLLQPIRELTKNWEIDVASELNDYLEELDEMGITFDDGQTRLNFAEAALLIQGSTCIYSKKVELLHSLVYQTLDYINDRNKKRNKKASNDTDGAASCEADDDEADDDEAEFVLLDWEVTGNNHKSDSKTVVCVTPLTPESLIPPETHEKNRLPLISVKGDVAFSQKDFRINLFVPQRDMIRLRLGPAGPLLSVRRHHGDGSDRQHQGAAGDADDGGGAEDGGDDLPEEEDPMEVEEHVERQQAASEAPMIRERRQVGADRRERAAVAPPAVNVWALHDPYATLGEDRPFRAGKCHKVPDGLDDGGKRKRRRGGGVQDFRSWFTGTFDPPKHKLKNGPTCTDLNYIYLKSLRDRVRTLHRIHRRAGLLVSEEALRRSALQLEQEGEEPVEALIYCPLLDGDVLDDEHDGSLDDAPAEFAAGEFMAADAVGDELSYAELLKLCLGQVVVNSHGYTQETALSRRVKDWEDNIRDQLELQEGRPAFDIHDYGRRIVGALSGVGQRRPFAAIVHSLDNVEVCKYLLASLQLANDYTVEIDSTTTGLESSCDSMSLTLLSTLRATDRFNTLSSAS